MNPRSRPLVSVETRGRLPCNDASIASRPELGRHARFGHAVELGPREPPQVTGLIVRAEKVLCTHSTFCSRHGGLRAWVAAKESTVHTNYDLPLEQARRVGCRVSSKSSRSCPPGPLRRCPRVSSQARSGGTSANALRETSRNLTFFNGHACHRGRPSLRRLSAAPCPPACAGRNTRP